MTDFKLLSREKWVNQDRREVKETKVNRWVNSVTFNSLSLSKSLFIHTVVK